MTARLYCGDALDVLPRLDAGSVDAIVTDPPYGLAFMGKDWDHGIPGAHFWTEILRVAKPGAHLVAFGGTRTHHRLMCAIEDAGWEIRDVLMWLYGSGFPKSHNGPWGGTALKPAWEPIILARKPLSEPNVAANVLKHGTGALNIDGSRIKTNEQLQGSTVRNDIRGGRFAAGHTPNPGDIADYAQSPLGRWPANVLLDVEAARLLDEQSGVLTSGKPAGVKTGGQANAYGYYRGGIPITGFGDSGGASRFFYCAKADREDRDGSTHPTVKPVDLMKWLLRLVVPPRGLVLDPFMGSGTTVYAARELGFRVIAIDRERAYCDDSVKRLRQGVFPL